MKILILALLFTLASCGYDSPVVKTVKKDLNTMIERCNDTSNNPQSSYTKMNGFVSCKDLEITFHYTPSPNRYTDSKADCSVKIDKQEYPLPESITQDCSVIAHTVKKAHELILANKRSSLMGVVRSN